MTTLDAAETWSATATALRKHRERGLANVLTEDSVRLASAQALVAAGVDGAELQVERPHPIIKGARVDLVVGNPVRAVIEFKYPREPAEKNAAWTMTLGEVLKDFYRLAMYPGDVSRLFVYVESRRLRQYMGGAAKRYEVDLDRAEICLRAEAIAGLPTTARDIISMETPPTVTARRTAVHDIDDQLLLSVYQVAACAEPVIDQAARTHPQPASADPLPTIEG